MDCRAPGFAVLHNLLEFLKLTSVESVMQSKYLILWPHPLPARLQSFLASGSFLMSCLFISCGQTIGASALTSVLLMNIQGWFPLGLTGLISLLSKGLWRVFSSNTIKKHQFFSAHPSLWPNTHIPTWLLKKKKKNSFDYTDLCWQNTVFAF